MIKAWVARDEDGTLWVFIKEAPKKRASFWVNYGQRFLAIDRNLFPEVKWEDKKPTEVEITIKPKKQ